MQRRLQQVGYGAGLQATGYYDAPTAAAVYLFQLQHVGPDARELVADRVVGPATQWALDHPSGGAQRSGYALAVATAVLPSRLLLLEALVEEYRRNVFEDPDGSNRSPHIDGYWGSTGLIGLPWCCTFVSTMLHRALGRYPIGGVHHTSVQTMYRQAVQLGLITTRPKPGDIFCQLHEDGTGHTGFGTAFSLPLTGAAMAATIEGNCGNRLKHGRRDRLTIEAWIDVFQDDQEEVFQDIALVNLGPSATR